jgi:transcriptional regulator with XRE-family HTH domain
MQEHDSLNPTVEGRAVRLARVLERLAAGGITQRQVAFDLNVPAQYLSDLKHARRHVTEQFARRVAEVYRIGASWLLQGQGPMDLPDLASDSESNGAGICLLPVLSRPSQGDPRQSSAWDGSVVALAGAAAAAAGRAKSPFVLRVSEEDRLGRLRTNDLVLCSQEPRDDAEFAIVLTAGGGGLARHTKKSQFETIDGRKVLPDAKSVGHCIAIVWATVVQNA